MRDELRALEGQQVHFRGRLKEWRRDDAGTVRICMAAVEVRPFAMDRPLKDAPVIKVDHIWHLNVQEDSVRCRKMLRKMEGIGTVAWYRRADGSVDLGLRCEASICLATIIAAAGVKEAKTPAQLLASIEWMEEGLARIAAGTPCYAWDIATERGLVEVRRYVERLRRDHAAEVKAFVGSLFSGSKPTRLNLLPLRNCRRTRAHGITA